MPVEQLRYVEYADRFGWTAEQVEDLPLWLEPWYLPLATMLDEVRTKLAKDEADRTRK